MGKEIFKACIDQVTADGRYAGGSLLVEDFDTKRKAILNGKANRINEKCIVTVRRYEYGNKPTIIAFGDKSDSGTLVYCSCEKVEDFEYLLKNKDNLSKNLELFFDIAEKFFEDEVEAMEYLAGKGIKLSDFSYDETRYEWAKAIAEGHGIYAEEIPAKEA